MVNYPPDFCPYCGTALETIAFDGRDRRHCENCDRIVRHNPVPCAGVAVVDRRNGERRVLCVERAVPPGVGEWTLPGGHVELDEEPAAAAARELEEETGVSVDPAALAIFDARSLPSRDGKRVVSIQYVVDRSATTGEPVAGTDAGAARFRTPAAFDASDEIFRPIHEQRFRSIAAGED